MTRPRTIWCRHRGCPRNARTVWDPWCSVHDGCRDHGDICRCQPPAPTPNGECGICRRLILALAHPAVAFSALGPVRPGAGAGNGVAGAGRPAAKAPMPPPAMPPATPTTTRSMP